MQRAVDHSLCFGGYAGGRRVAFARLVSDYATFAYLVDVHALEECRGRGAGGLKSVLIAISPRKIIATTMGCNVVSH